VSSNILYDEVRVFRQHPHLNEALTVHIDSYLNGFARSEFITKLASEDIEYLLALKTVALGFDEGTVKSFTKAHLQSFAKTYAIATPNRVSSLVDIAIHTGYLTGQRSQTDLRENLLTPTLKFEKCAYSGLQPYLRPLNLLFENAYGHLSSDRAAIAQISAYALHVYSLNFPIRQRSPCMVVFTRRDAGYEILLKILQASNSYTDHPDVVISLPFFRLSRTFGVSRGHVQKLFQAAETAGLLRIHAKGGKEIEILPSLQKIARDTIVCSLAIAKMAFDLTSDQLFQSQRSGLELV